MARPPSVQGVETVGGHRLLFAERLAPDSAAATRKETRAILQLLEKTRQLIESSTPGPEE